MIDTHCHVLPQLDDGSPGIDHSISMCENAVKYEVRKLIATPHYIENSTYSACKESVLEKLNEVNRILKERKLDIEILPGMEIYISSCLPEWLEKGQVLTLNHSRYVLIELPQTDIPLCTEEVFFKLQQMGYIPVLAHPERNIKLQHNTDILERYVTRGILLQTNTGSLLGKYSKQVRHFATELLERNWVSFLGSDAHSGYGRYSSFTEAGKIISRTCGKEMAVKVLSENPAKMIRNEALDPGSMKTVKPRFSLFKLFRK